MLNDDKRVRFIIGHYGSGKTEFSMNYAVKLQELGKKVIVADLDIVNMYFRSREKQEEFEEKGIKIVGSIGNMKGVDVPAVSPEVKIPLEDTSYDGIIDVGGDSVGARALGGFVDFFEKGDYDMFMVLNANRPETQTVEKAYEYLRQIEAVSRARVTGIVNNTHLLKATTVEDVLRGQKLAEELAEKANIPVKYIAALEHVAKELPEDLEGEVFPMTLYMREDWMI